MGDELCAGRLSQSVAATVTMRYGRVLQSIFEIRTMLDDCRSHVAGGITTGLHIWEMAVIPYITNNSECWLKISPETISKLEFLRNLFYRVLLNVPTGCPISIMYWDCGGLLMVNRILKHKLVSLHQLAVMDNDSLAKQIFNVQCKLFYSILFYI